MEKNRWLGYLTMYRTRTIFFNLNLRLWRKYHSRGSVNITAQRAISLIPQG